MIQCQASKVCQLLCFSKPWLRAGVLIRQRLAQRGIALFSGAEQRVSGLSHTFFRSHVEPHSAGNTENTLAYLKGLQQQFAQQRLLVLWDGASYHRSHEVRELLAKVNDGLPEAQWPIHCVQFAPNDPTQNPIEDVWLQAKNWLRRMAGLKPCFAGLKALFEQFLDISLFDFPKMYHYGKVSEIT